REDVVAIHDLGGDAVGGAFVGNVLAAHLEFEGRRVGVLIVIAEEDDRRLLHGGEIDAFVPIAPAGRGVAGVAEDDAVDALVAHRHGGYGGDGDGGGEGADDGDDADTEVAHVHVAVAAAGESAFAAHILRHHAAGGCAADKKDGHVAVRGAEEIL